MNRISTTYSVGCVRKIVDKLSKGQSNFETVLVEKALMPPNL